jgi:hypothetical protein
MRKNQEAIHSVFLATLLLSVTALFREPKAREDHPTLKNQEVVGKAIVLL